MSGNNSGLFGGKINVEQPVDTFFRRFSLRTGGIVVGCFYMIVGIVGITIEFFELRRLEYYEYCSTCFVLLNKIVGAATLIVFPLYLFGIFNQRKWFMLPALLWHVVYVLIQTMVLGPGILMSIPLALQENFIKTLVLALLASALLALQWYFLIVSYSLFRQIKDSDAATQYDQPGAVYHTAEELANMNQVNVEAATDATGPSAPVECTK